MKRILLITICSGLLAATPARLGAETGYEAWLRYAPLDESVRAKYASLPATVTIIGDSQVLHSRVPDDGHSGRQRRVFCSHGLIQRRVSQPRFIAGLSAQSCWGCCEKA